MTSTSTSTSTLDDTETPTSTSTSNSTAQSTHHHHISSSSLPTQHQNQQQRPEKPKQKQKAKQTNAFNSKSKHTSSSLYYPRHKKYIDIGCNLTAEQFHGIYHSKSYHPADLHPVIQRAHTIGVTHIIVTAGNLRESQAALALCQQYEHLYCTVGVHPTRANEVLKHAKSNNQHDIDYAIQQYMNELESICCTGSNTNSSSASPSSSSPSSYQTHPKIVAIGECGLDYDRLHFSDKESQLRVFPAQILLASKLHLPLFLHNRNSTEDFVSIMKQHMKELHSISRCQQKHGKHGDDDQAICQRGAGVVHSFTGTLDELQRIMSIDDVETNMTVNGHDNVNHSNRHIGEPQVNTSKQKKQHLLYIGINGCSLKTVANFNVVKQIPLDRLMLETDAPYCDIKPTHASYPYVATHFQTVKAEKYRVEEDDGIQPHRHHSDEVKENVNVKAESTRDGADDVMNLDSKKWQLVKSRCEPCQIVQVAEVLAAVRQNQSIEQIADTAYHNTKQLFFHTDT